jgi:F0F1-type ATP synthase epsilon subunit
VAADTSRGATYPKAYQAKPGGKEAEERLKVKIFSPYQTYYEDTAISLSAANRTGPFDVLPGHINFFSLLAGGKVVVNTGFQVLEFDVSRGIIRVTNDAVTLFVDV